MSLVNLPRRIYRLIKSGSSQSQPFLEYRDYLEKGSSYFDKAYFNLTIDFELAWSRSRRGDRVTSKSESLDRSRLIRRVFPDFISLCETYDVPVTFAVIARLLVDDLVGFGPIPTYWPTWLRENWYRSVSDINLAQNVNYCGTDLMRKIRESRVEHEIASHGFSHVDLGEETITREIALFEINKSTEILKDFGEKPSSFIFPNNRVAYIDILKENDYQIYRIRKNEKVNKDEFGLWKFPVGIWLSPNSFNSKELIDLIDLAIKKKTLVNFFCHLYEFRSPRQLEKYLSPVFKYLQERSELIEVVTMKKFINNLSTLKYDQS